MPTHCAGVPTRKNVVTRGLRAELAALEHGPGDARNLVATLPYQVATPLLMELLLGTPALERMPCTIQREVAERFRAAVRTAAYGPVSVIAQSLADVAAVARVPPTAFWPRPQVETSMLTIRPFPRARVDIEDVAAFVAFVRRGFAQRRKMLRNVLAAPFGDDAAGLLDEAGVTGDAPPAELPPPAWRRLSATAARRRP